MFRCRQILIFLWLFRFPHFLPLIASRFNTSDLFVTPNIDTKWNKKKYPNVCFPFAIVVSINIQTYKGVMKITIDVFEIRFSQSHLILWIIAKRRTNLYHTLCIDQPHVMLLYMKLRCWKHCHTIQPLLIFSAFRFCVDVVCVSRSKKEFSCIFDMRELFQMKIVMRQTMQ